jgi:tocopherol cyclase
MREKLQCRGSGFEVQRELRSGKVAVNAAAAWVSLSSPLSSVVVYAYQEHAGRCRALPEPPWRKHRHRARSLLVSSWYNDHPGTGPRAVLTGRRRSASSLDASPVRQHVLSGGSRGSLRTLKRVSGARRRRDERCCHHEATKETADPLELPHAGVHMPSVDRGFFEGWYVRIVLPTEATSLAFMYSLEDGRRGRIQVLSSGVQDELLVSREMMDGFFPALRHLPTSTLRIGQWGRTSDLLSDERAEHARSLAPSLFREHVHTGYQLSAQWHQGSIQADDVDRERSMVAHLSPDISCAFDMRIEPLLSWGSDGARSTGTWLTRFQVFEPGWQILSAFARTTGIFRDWHGRVFRFERAPTYIEKNWGSAFPSRWFWLQCHVFDVLREDASSLELSSADIDAPLTLTCVGARRELCWPQRPNKVVARETIGIIAFHWKGYLWEFAAWNCRRISWSVQWGNWQMEAHGTRYSVKVSAETAEPGAYVLGPTRHGMQFVVRDGARGTLRLQLRDEQANVVILDALCRNAAAVELGGELASDPNGTSWTAERGAFPPPVKALFLIGERPGRAVRV